MHEPIIEANRVAKTYGTMRALDDVSFRLAPNKIYGLLGRNGAGKTTLMHILTAQQFATRGEVRLFGEAPYENDAVLRRICFVKESQTYPKTLQVRNVLDLSGSFFPSWDREYALRLASLFELPLDRRMNKLSRGMLSAVGIIIGLASRAPLTIFDEPYLGLDAAARRLFYDLLLEDYAEHPRTIVLSTHLIDEVSRMLEHVLILDRGRLLVNEEADALRGMAYTVTGPKAKAEAFAVGRDVLHAEAVGGLASLTVKGAATPDAIRKAESLGLELGAVSLQQLFVHLTNPIHSDGKAASGQ
ncbi:ABC transporter ATP-binding protein [Paenibacillus sp.]|uniref:ABC transporter ATP-binding protein n=1 Tax=Paenibacillus sp. TaxID=58172 RepID=UPI002D65BE57|nr:ABC transporter ATP-binding protein [Paenibacillus sp.]HZG86460.1 ABC transporter ATP-binding protein [Paenibacillus sp.]